MRKTRVVAFLLTTLSMALPGVVAAQAPAGGSAPAPAVPAPASGDQGPAPVASSPAGNASASAGPAPKAEGPGAPGEGDWWTPPLFGDPTPLTRRPPTNRTLTFEGGFKFGLVGTGPTRFVTDLRLSLWDYIDVHTQLGPVLIPETLIGRVSMGNYRRFGRVGLEGGLHKFDIGARIFPESGQATGFNPNVVPSVNTVLAVTYDLPIWDRLSIHVSARGQQRLQHSVKALTEGKVNNPLDQMSGQLAVQASWDVTKMLGFTVGAAYGTAVDNVTVGDWMGRVASGTAPWDDPVVPRWDTQKAIDRKDPASAFDLRSQCSEGRTKTLWLDFAEFSRPGFSTLVDREMNCSASIMGALTYGRTEAFDVDLFGNLRVWPQVGGVFGAAIRWRIAP